jgi:hypothetical protein
MPKVLVCVLCFEEIEAKEKWLDVPGRMNEVAHLKCWKENTATTLMVDGGMRG